MSTKKKVPKKKSVKPQSTEERSIRYFLLYAVGGEIKLQQADTLQELASKATELLDSPYVSNAVAFGFHGSQIPIKVGGNVLHPHLVFTDIDGKQVTTLNKGNYRDVGLDGQLFDVVDADTGEKEKPQDEDDLFGF